jgi:serine/threonine protein kinase
MDKANNWCVILCDFGLCHVTNDKASLLQEFVGSPGFFGPEMVTEKSYWGDKVDLWSCGAVLLEMVLGHEKFSKTWMPAYEPELVKNREEFAKAVKGAVNRVKKLPGLSVHLIDLLGKILNINSSERTSIKDILRHPWLIGAETPATSYSSSINRSCDSFGDEYEFTLPRVVTLENLSSTDSDQLGSLMCSLPTLTIHSPHVVSAVEDMIVRAPMRPPSAPPSEASKIDAYGRTKKYIKF